MNMLCRFLDSIPVAVLASTIGACTVGIESILFVEAFGGKNDRNTWKDRDI